MASPAGGLTAESEIKSMRNGYGGVYPLRQWGGFCRLALTGLVLLTLITISGRPGFSQGGAGTITGTVTDPKGLTVPGASVLIHNTDTNLDRTLPTTDAGLYTATFLPSGHYEVTASKEGFARQVRKDLTLQVGQTMTIDFAMAIQTAESVVTVTSEAPVLETSRTEASQEVSETLAAGLPLNGRRWEQFVFLTPAVTNDGGSGLTTYHGISGLFNNSTVDGTSNRQAFFSENRGRSAVAYTYSLDAVKEFAVNSSAYSAEFGQAAGGQINAVTKSGSNAFHGDLFYYLRYPTLNALDPFSESRGIFSQPEHQRQQFGGSLGGPIKKDKLFYFANYDGQRRSFPIIFSGPSSSNAFAAVNNLAAGLVPSGPNSGPCSTYVGLPAAGGAVTLSPTSVVGLSAQQCQTAINYIMSTIGAQPRKGTQDVFLGKLDYQASTNNHLSATFDWMNWHNPNGAQAATTFTAGSNTQNGSFDSHERIFIASWNAVMSPTMVNDFRFQWSRDFQFFSANFSGPSVALGSLFGYGMPNFLPRAAFPDEHRLQFTDSVSVVHDKHTVKVGLDISPIHEKLINLFQGGGVYNYSYTDTNSKPFTTAATAQNIALPVFDTSATTLQAWIADVYGLPLSNDPSSGAFLGKHFNTFAQAKDVINTPQEAGKDDFYDVDYGAYVQDSWKMRPSLTLNLGLRWDLQWIPQPPNPNQNALANYYTNKINIPKFNFGPRFGLAWQASRNSVVRGGYGIFYGNTTNSLFYDTRVENGVVQQTFNCNASFTPSSGQGSPSNCSPPFPNILFPAPGPSLQQLFPGSLTPQAQNINSGSLNPSSLALRGQPPDFLPPMVHEAEIGYERQLPWNLSASGTFMITKGQHLPVCPDANLAPPGTPIVNTAANTPIAGLPAGAVTTPPSTITLIAPAGSFLNGAVSVAGNTITLPFFTSRIDPGVGIITTCKSVVHSRYEAGIFTVKKQFSHGVELLANYTVAQAQDDGQVSNQVAAGTFSGGSDAPLNPLNQQSEWGTSDYDQRQRLVLSFLYAPSFKVQNSMLSYLVNGFSFGGIVTISSPFPVNALISATVTPCLGPSCGLLNPCAKAGDICGVDAGVTGAVAINASNSPGRTPVFPKNSFRGPTQTRVMDFRVTKDLKIFKERYKMQVIAEAFNLFNHPVVTGVLTSAYSVTYPSSPSSPTLNPISSFLTPSQTGNGLVGARQMQFSAKLNF